MYKKLSMALFIFWSISLVLILTFGTQVASMISNSVSQVIFDQKNKLQDVTLEKTEYPIEQPIYLDLILYPDTFSEDNIVYTSLTPELFVVNKNGYVLGNQFEGEKAKGKILITNKLDDNFKKEIELTFYKTYPTNIELFLCDENKQIKNDYNAYLNVPFFIHTNFEPDETFISEKNISCEYNEELFSLSIDENQNIKLIPKHLNYQVGDNFEPVKTNLKVLLNGTVIKEYQLSINPSKEYESFNKVMISKYQEDITEINNSIFVKDNFAFVLYNNEEKLTTNYTVKSLNPEIIEVTQENEIKCIKSGYADLEISLDNGFKIIQSIFVRNRISAPKLKGVNFNEDNEIVIKQDTIDVLYLNFSKDVSYKTVIYHADPGLSIKYNKEGNSVNIGSKNSGKYDLVLTIDDGYEEPVIINLVVNVIHNKNSFKNIISEFSRFLAKILGHMSFFILEALLAFFMMYYYKGKNNWINAIIYISIGLFLASLTEFIQIFMPGRSARIIDVLIDMGGYIIGLILSLIIYKTIYKIKNKKKEKVM